MKKDLIIASLFALALSGVACSDDPAPGGGTGGTPGSGGSATGGTPGSGGSATGGTPGTGGSATGGTPGSGGTTTDGGAETGSETGAETGAETGGETGGGETGSDSTMSFFVTSRGHAKGGDFRLNPTDTDGLAGADALCKELATAVSADLGAKNWKAYLSTSTVDARSRIGTGPWRNAKGVVIAETVAQLHEEGGMTNSIRPNANMPSNALDEKGMTVPMGGGANGVHDILTGSTAMGTKDAMNRHCNNWTSMAADATGAVGHHDRAGSSAAATSWNAAHATGGCAPVVGDSRTGTVGSGGGRGSIYCFVAN